MSIGTGTVSGRLTVAGNIVALNGSVKQQTYSFDVPNMSPYVSNAVIWTHNLGYQPVIMISPQQQSGNSYGVAFSYIHLDNNRLEIRCTNYDGLYDADIILRWMVVN